MSMVRSKKEALLIATLLTLGLLLGSVAFAFEKPVSIEVDGKVIQTKVLFSSTVGDVLDQNQVILSDKDLVEPSRETAITKDLQIKVTRSFPIKVVADGTTREFQTIPVTIKQAVAAAGFKLGENDILKVSAGGFSKEIMPTQNVFKSGILIGEEGLAPVSDQGGENTPNFKIGPSKLEARDSSSTDTEMVISGQLIEIIRITERELAVDEPITYQVEETVDNTLEQGMSRTLQEGKNGLVRTTFLVTYRNGQEIDREKIKTETLAEPQNQVIAMGSSYTVSRGGQRFDFREARNMESTAYTYTGHRTATGLKPAVGLVAVDPSVIPLGTRMYIEGYGYATAADTGGAIKGNRIDVFLETYTQCINWGRKTVKVYLLP